MVPQRDRAFSWDVSFENTMHTDLAGNPIPAVSDLNHLVNIPNPSSQGSTSQQPHQHPMNPPDMKDSSKLFIKAQFPTKSKKAESVLESLPSIKMEVGKMEGFPSSSQADKLDSIPIDHFDLGSEDEDQEDGYYEDPLLLSIPPELLMGDQQQGGANNNNNNNNNNASGNNNNSNSNHNNGSGNGTKRRSRNGKHHHNNESKKSSPGTPSSNLAGLSMNNNNGNSSGSNNNKSGSGLTFTIGKFPFIFLIFDCFNGYSIIFRRR
jgi:hypothetical protein